MSGQIAVGCDALQIPEEIKEMITPEMHYWKCNTSRMQKNNRIYFICHKTIKSWRQMDGWSTAAAASTTPLMLINPINSVCFWWWGKLKLLYKTTNRHGIQQKGQLLLEIELKPSYREAMVKPLLHRAIILSVLYLKIFRCNLFCFHLHANLSESEWCLFWHICITCSRHINRDFLG